MASDAYSVSPLDGRYRGMVGDVSTYLSEGAITENMIKIELRWLQRLVELGITPVKELSQSSREALDGIVCDMPAIAVIECKTKHVVKSVEYYVRSQLETSESDELRALSHWVHMFCTSEDIQSPSYTLGLKACMNHLVEPLMLIVIQTLAKFAKENAHVPLLARTHGQPASPTTVGKEIAVYAARLSYQLEKNIKRIDYFAKFGGAVGNFNAHIHAFPNIDWPSVARDFIEELGLVYQEYTTQVECHDYISELCDSLARFNTILRDLSVDLWLYISRGVFQLVSIAGEVGSSTMPHKINPWHAECAEGNIGIANSLLRHMSDKLPTNRLQRDLSDSTTLRNLSVAIAHSVLAMKLILIVFSRIGTNPKNTLDELDHNWVVLSEAVQTSLKAAGDIEGFEALLKKTRGIFIDKVAMKEILLEYNDRIPNLIQLQPTDYLGCAKQLGEGVEEYIAKRKYN